MSIKPLSKIRHRIKGSSIIELIIVTVLFVVTVPAVLGIFVGARKINGQGYLQQQAAITLNETNDILRYLRNLDFSQLPNGEFFLIRNPGTGSWLVKSDLPDKDAFERHVMVSDATRHTGSNDLYLEGDVGPSYDDPDTKKVDIEILWAPDYLPLDLVNQTVYISNWEKVVTYPSS